MILVELASVSDTERDDTTINDNWQVIASGESAEVALSELVELINDEMLDDVNNWLRIREVK